MKRDNERREESEVTREREGSFIVPGRVLSNANDRMQGSVLINPCQPTPDQTRVFFKRPCVSWWREGGKNDTPQDKLICPWNDQAISQCIGKLVLALAVLHAMQENNWWYSSQDVMRLARMLLCCDEVCDFKTLVLSMLMQTLVLVYNVPCGVYTKYGRNLSPWKWANERGATLALSIWRNLW